MSLECATYPRFPCGFKFQAAIVPVPKTTVQKQNSMLIRKRKIWSTIHAPIVFMKVMLFSSNLLEN